MLWYNLVTERGTEGVVLCTYEGIRQHQSILVDQRWQYVVLDEGHKIRNPDADITLVCKMFKVWHRCSCSFFLIRVYHTDRTPYCFDGRADSEQPFRAVVSV